MCNTSKTEKPREKEKPKNETPFHLSCRARLHMSCFVFCFFALAAHNMKDIKRGARWPPDSERSISTIVMHCMGWPVSFRSSLTYQPIHSASSTSPHLGSQTTPLLCPIHTHCRSQGKTSLPFPRHSAPFSPTFAPPPPLPTVPAAQLSKNREGEGVGALPSVRPPATHHPTINQCTVIMNQSTN